MTSSTERTERTERIRARLRVLAPADLKLRGAPRYQWARRATLVASWLVVVVVPLSHARLFERTSAGIFDAPTAAVLPLPDVLARSAIGSPTSIAIFGFELVDPLAALGVWLGGGGSWALVEVMALAALLVLFLGRFFCGWLCPYTPIVAASNALRALLARFGWRPRDVGLPKRASFVALAVLLTATLVSGSQVALLFYPPAVLGREVWRLVYFGGLGGGAGLLAVCFVFDTFYARAGTCRYLCPGGALFTLLGRWSPIRIVRDSERCTDCALCDLVCNMRQSPMTDGVDSGCDRCARCVSVCPTKALRIGSATP